MSIRVDQSVPGEGGFDIQLLQVNVAGEKDIAAFRQLVYRATNLWPDAPPEIKEFADIISFGAPQQDYSSQAKDKHRTIERTTYNHLCPKCDQVTSLLLYSEEAPDYLIKCEQEVEVGWIKVDPTGVEEAVQISKNVPCKFFSKFNPVR